MARVSLSLRRYRLYSWRLHPAEYGHDIVTCTWEQSVDIVLKDLVCTTRSKGTRIFTQLRTVAAMSCTVPGTRLLDCTVPSTCLTVSEDSRQVVICDAKEHVRRYCCDAIGSPEVSFLCVPNITHLVSDERGLEKLEASLRSSSISQ